MPDRVSSYQHDGLEFEVTDTGPLDGEVIVLLHGFPQRPSSWAKVAARLNTEGYRTVAPAQRGYSEGARPKGRRAYNADRLVEDIRALVDELGVGKVHLVGHDWGSAVAWGVASRHPDRLHSLVAVSVSHPAAFTASMFRSDQFLRSWYMAAFQLPFLPERLASSRATADRMLRRAGMDQAMVDRFHEEFPDAASLTGPINWYRAMALGFPKDTGHRIRVPTTLVWSDGDVALGRKGVDLAERYVAAPYRLVVLEGVSHWIPEQAPEPLAEAVLERVRGTA